MKAALLDANGMIVDCIIVRDMQEAPKYWVECPEYLGVGYRISDIDPASIIEESNMGIPVYEYT